MPNSTQFYQSDKTELYSSRGSEEHQLSIGQKIILNDSEYTILSIISKDSGEAVIYKIEDSEGKIFALKMYFQFRSESDEPNPESLSRILKITDSDLLKLHNFGIGENKYEGKFCFEISDFAQGGDLLSVDNFNEKHDLKFLESKVIPQIFKGILTLHRNKIFHCDLKPQNVFFRDENRTNLVIGDYGSAKTFDFENGKDSRKTSTVKGTDFYLPPEQARGFISEKNDYYSFGMILLHLVYPEKVCQNNSFSRLNRQKLKQIIENQFENRPIIEFDESKGRINDLIAGLTLNSVSSRWGANEVRRWLHGETPEVIYQSSQSNKEVSPIDLGDRIIRTEADLVKFIEQDEEWYELLIEDKTGRYIFYKWLMSIQHHESKNTMDRIIRINTPLGLKFLKEAILRFFQPYRPIIVKQRIYDFAITGNIIHETAKFFGRLIYEKVTEEELKLYLFQYKLIYKKLTDSVNRNLLNQALIEAHKSINPNATSPFPMSHLKLWMFQGLVEMTGHKYQFLCYERINKEGIHYKVQNDWSDYFRVLGDDLPLQVTTSEIMDFPDYPHTVNEKNNALYFISDTIYQFTLDYLSKEYPKISSSNYRNFQDMDSTDARLLKNSVLQNQVCVNLSSKLNDTPRSDFADKYIIDYEYVLPEIYIDKKQTFVHGVINHKVYQVALRRFNQTQITDYIKRHASDIFGRQMTIYYKSEVIDPLNALMTKNKSSFFYFMVIFIGIIIFLFIRFSS